MALWNQLQNTKPFSRPRNKTMHPTTQNISIQNRPSNRRFFYNISLREKNGVKLTKVNNFSYNTLTTNNLLLNNNIFQLMVFLPFLGYLRQYLTTLSDSGLNETIEKKINTELVSTFNLLTIYPINYLTI